MYVLAWKKRGQDSKEEGQDRFYMRALARHCVESPLAPRSQQLSWFRTGRLCTPKLWLRVNQGENYEGKLCGQAFCWVLAALCKNTPSLHVFIWQAAKTNTDVTKARKTGGQREGVDRIKRMNLIPQTIMPFNSPRYLYLHILFNESISRSNFCFSKRSSLRDSACKDARLHVFKAG